MTNSETLSYIKEHQTDDPCKLALQSHPSAVNIQYALEQIAGWQAARQKLPSWAETDGIVFPPHLSMEQCSSEQTTLYKSRLAERLLKDTSHDGQTMLLDLTGGFGVDFSYIAPLFDKATYVERQDTLCETVRHNLPLLGLPDAEVMCADGTEYLTTVSCVSMIFIDPARRNDNGGKTFAIADCTPDVASLADVLVDKADVVMIKLSPMLDWHKAVEDMKHVAEVHIVAVKNECKELLLVLKKDVEPSQLSLYCADCHEGDDAKCGFAIDRFEVDNDKMQCLSEPFATPAAGMYLYEPNASLMKAGCFTALSSRFAMPQVARNSHLFLSEHLQDDFHGRRFVIESVCTMNKKELRKSLSGIDKANIAVRNFPMSVVELRKRLKLKDGGTHYIFATTSCDNVRMLLVCKKV